MRLGSFIASTLLFTSPLLAEDFYVASVVVAATVHPTGAIVTNEVSLSMPAGAHRILFPYESWDEEQTPKIISTEGAVFGPVVLMQSASLGARKLLTPSQEIAWQEVEQRDSELETLDDAITVAQLAKQSLDAKLTYLSSIRSAQEEITSTEILIETAELVHTQVAEVLAEQDAFRRTIREYQETRKDLVAELAAASHAFERLSPSNLEGGFVALNVEVEKPQSVSFVFETLVADAGWNLQYDVNLESNVNPTVSIERNSLVYQYSGSMWTDIDLTLSTTNLDGGTEPRTERPDRAMIYTPEPQMSSSLDVVVMEPAVIMEESSGGRLLPMGQENAGIVSYHYPTRITVAHDEVVKLELDTLQLAAEALIYAAPRHDDTAFHIAKFVNTSGEPILSGTASYYREGQLVGRSRFNAIPAGGEAELAFGRAEGIRLNKILTQAETGDTGIISRSNTKQQSMILIIENLTDQPQSVRAIYALPYSEQEDLRITVRAQPRPTELDIDNERGVNRWTLNLAPGEKKEIQLEISLDWPAGQELNWWP